MEPVQSEPLQPSQSSPQSSTISTFLSRKKPLVAALLVLVFLLVVLSFLSRKQSPAQKQQPTKTTTSQQATMTGLEVAEKTALFLKKAQRPNGSFYLQYRCSPTIQDICVVQMHEGPNGLITNAFLEFFKRTGKFEYKTIADHAIAYQVAACEKKIRDCELAFTALAAYYDETKDNRYKNAILRAASHVLSDKSLVDHLGNNDGGKLESLFKATRDEKYKLALIRLADRYLGGEFQNQSTDAGFFIAYYIYLPAYRVTNDSRYLEAAKTIFTKANLSTTVSQFEKGNNHVIATGFDALVSLSQLDPSYKKDVKAVGEFLLRTVWDTPTHKKFVGDYGFIHFFGEKDPNFKYTVNTGGLAKSFAIMGKEKFVVQQ